VIENLDPNIAAKSNEALQGIVSVYNKDNMTVNTINVSNLNTGSIKGTTDLELSGGNIKFSGNNICAGDVCVNSNDFMMFISKLSKNNYMYSSDPQNYIIFNNLPNSLAPSQNQLTSSQPFAKYGNPYGFDSTKYSNGNLFYGSTLLILGVNGTINDGLVIKVPKNNTVLWVRILNDRNSILQLYSLNNDNNNNYGVFASGYRNVNNMAPDGSGNDMYTQYHVWIPIRLTNSNINTDRKYVLYNPGTTSDGTISGIAFSTNPWNHASCCSYTNFLGSNGDDTLYDYTTVFNYDLSVGIGFGGKSITKLKVPVVYSGKDKLVYLIEGGAYTVTNAHTGLTVNNKQIERFKTTYDNPFSRHFNSKPFQRYVAAKIPASSISQGDLFITLAINMQNQNAEYFFREVGTHDLY